MKKSKLKKKTTKKKKVKPSLKDVLSKLPKTNVILQDAEQSDGATSPEEARLVPKFVKRMIYEARFKNAVKYAKFVMLDWDLKDEIKTFLPKGKRVYNFLITYYLADTRIKSKSGGRLFTDLSLKKSDRSSIED